MLGIKKIENRMGMHVIRKYELLSYTTVLLDSQQILKSDWPEDVD